MFSSLPLWLRQVLFLFSACLIYAAGYYHRACTGQLMTPLAKALNVKEASIGILGSSYFWSYAVIQPFIGPLADVFKTKTIVTISLLICAIGTIVCAVSKNFNLTCVARAVVGISCGCFYVPISRAVAQWFTPRGFTYAQSFLVACSGVGGLIAQYCVGGYLNSDSLWKWAFYAGTIANVFLAILAVLFIESSPKAEEKIRPTIKESFSQLWENVKLSVCVKELWLIAAWKFFVPSTYASVSATWGTSYLKNGLGYTGKIPAQYISMTSIAEIIGSPLLAFITNLVHSRKYTIFACSVISLGTCIGFIFVKPGSSNALVLSLLFIFAAASGGSMIIAAIILKEIHSNALVGTLIGLANSFLFVGTSIEQVITSDVASNYEGTGKTIPFAAYKWGLWLLSSISCVIGIIPTLFLSDTFQKSFGKIDVQPMVENSVEKTT